MSGQETILQHKIHSPDKPCAIADSHRTFASCPFGKPSCDQSAVIFDVIQSKSVQHLLIQFQRVRHFQKKRSFTTPIPLFVMSSLPASSESVPSCESSEVRSATCMKYCVCIILVDTNKGTQHAELAACRLLKGVLIVFLVIFATQTPKAESN